MDKVLQLTLKELGAKKMKDGLNCQKESTVRRKLFEMFLEITD